jgi:hypothetical protein
MVSRLAAVPFECPSRTAGLVRVRRPNGGGVDDNSPPLIVTVWVRVSIRPVPLFDGGSVPPTRWVFLLPRNGRKSDTTTDTGS